MRRSVFDSMTLDKKRKQKAFTTQTTTTQLKNQGFNDSKKEEKTARDNPLDSSEAYLC